MPLPNFTNFSKIFNYGLLIFENSSEFFNLLKKNWSDFSSKDEYIPGDYNHQLWVIDLWKFIRGFLTYWKSFQILERKNPIFFLFSFLVLILGLWKIPFIWINFLILVIGFLKHFEKKKECNIKRDNTMKELQER